MNKVRFIAQSVIVSIPLGVLAFALLGLPTLMTMDAGPSWTAAGITFATALVVIVVMGLIGWGLHALINRFLPTDGSARLMGVFSGFLASLFFWQFLISIIVGLVLGG